jgi:glycosyltransferase involved in cell wall biosynthesis
MKLVVDGYWWRSGPHSNRMVLMEIVRHWPSEYPEDELIVAVPKSRVPTEPQDAPTVRTVDTHLQIHPVINAFELPVVARRLHADGILAFNFASLSRRGVIFLHDVLFQTNPEWFTPIERVYFAGMPALARRAKSVITTSKSEQIRISHSNPKLNRVVNCGLSIAPSLKHAQARKPDLQVESDSFVVCVGRFNVRKNLDTTIRALIQTGLLSKSFPLVLVGETSGAAADISDFSAPAADGMILTASHLTEGELKWLYENCRLFVCLSLDEGFGLPVVEAAVFGAPVLASDIPVFRENLGSWGTFVQPTDEKAIATAAISLASNGRSTTAYVERHTWGSICRDIRNELLREPQRERNPSGHADHSGNHPGPGA